MLAQYENRVDQSGTQISNETRAFLASILAAAESNATGINRNFPSENITEIDRINLARDDDVF